MTPRATIRGRVGWAVLGVLWLAGVGGGLAWLAGYDNRPGEAATARTRWPGESAVPPDSAGPTLVMFAHPLCDCTRASLAELAELMARATPSPRAYVLFVEPASRSAAWDQAETPTIARRIPGVIVRRDDNGVEARRFGARTSGQVFLYAADGPLLFAGGTTRARGHVGDNVGRDSILALLSHRSPGETETPVFGCSLFGPDDDPPLKR